MDQDEAMLLWQDVLDLVAAGRTGELVCPFCKKGQVQVKEIEGTKQTRLECPACRQFIVGRFRQE
jgi:ribosomal protein L37AE/L43A